MTTILSCTATSFLKSHAHITLMCFNLLTINFLTNYVSYFHMALQPELCKSPKFKICAQAHFWFKLIFLILSYICLIFSCLTYFFDKVGINYTYMYTNYLYIWIISAGNKRLYFTLIGIAKNHLARLYLRNSSFDIKHLFQAKLNTGNSIYSQQSKK